MASADITLDAIETLAFTAYGYVVEVGEGLPNANSYLSVADANALLSHHPDAATWASKTLAEKQAALINASLYLDRRYRWYGKAKTGTQVLQWPRTKNIDMHGRVIAAGIIPDQLKKAVALNAMQWSQENLFASVSEEGAIKSFSVGSLSISYDKADTGSTGVYGKAFPDMDLLLNSIGERKPLDFVDRPIYDGV